MKKISEISLGEDFDGNLLYLRQKKHVDFNKNLVLVRNPDELDVFRIYNYSDSKRALLGYVRKNNEKVSDISLTPLGELSYEVVGE